MRENVSCKVLPLPVLISVKQIILFQYSLQTKVQGGAPADMPVLPFGQLVSIRINISLILV